MSQVDSAYAQALYSLAQDEGLAQDILAQLQVLQAAFADQPQFVQLLATPGLSLPERLHILDASFADKVHPYLLNFLKLLTEKGRVRSFADCCKAYKNQYNLDNGILPVTAVTAFALRDDQCARLAAKMQQLTGKHIDLTNRVDAACVGGMRLEYDGKQVDDTIASRLQQMQGLLKNTVL